LRYYAAFRGKKSMIYATPSQIRYLNYFESYMILLTKHQSTGAIEKLMKDLPIDGESPGQVQRSVSPTPRAKSSIDVVAKATPALLKKIILDFVCPVQYVVLKTIELIHVPKSYLSSSLSIWFRITHADFVYESKGKVHPIRNPLNNKIQMPVADKTSKDGCPLLNNDIKFELFVSKRVLFTAWFNTRFLEPANVDEDYEEALEAIQTLEAKSIAKWNAEDKQNYQDAMELVRKHKTSVLVPEEQTQMESKGGESRGSVAGRDFDVYKLSLDKKKN